MNWRDERAKWERKLAELEVEEKALREAGEEIEAAAVRMDTVAVREHLRRLEELL